MATAYIAYPIDAAHGEPEEMPDLILEMRRAGVWSFLPGRPWEGVSATLGTSGAQLVSQVNEAALRGADILVAVLTGDPTLGVPVEIDFAVRTGKPVVIWLLCPPSVQTAAWAAAGAHVVRHRGSLSAAVRDAVADSGAASGRAVPSDLTGTTEEVNDGRRRIAVQVGPAGRMPTRAYEGDAGFDLYVAEGYDRAIGPGEFVDVPVDVSAQFPPDTWGWIVGRSSTLRTRGLLVNQGIIDQGYRGELFVGVLNPTSLPVRVVGPERLAQLIPMPLVARDVRLVPADYLTPTDRGSAGFGSTGT